MLFLGNKKLNQVKGGNIVLNKIDIDNSVSPTSENAVQSKVLYNIFAEIKDGLTLLQGGIETVRTNQLADENNIAALQNSVTTIQNTISTIQGNITTINSTLTNLQSSIDNINTEITSIKERIATLEGYHRYNEGVDDNLDELLG